MISTEPSLRRVFSLWGAMGIKTQPVPNKDYFLNRLKEISKIQENRERRVYKCDLRLDLIKKYSDRDNEMIDWLLAVIRNERFSNINYALEAMYALEQINPERAMKELKYYASVSCENNEKIKDPAIRVVTCHLSQAIERDFDSRLKAGPTILCSSADRWHLLRPHIEVYGKELVTISLARLFLGMTSSLFIKEQALLSLQEIEPDKTIEIILSEMKRSR